MTGSPLPCEKGFAFCHSDPNGLGPGNKGQALTSTPMCHVFITWSFQEKYSNLRQ